VEAVLELGEVLDTRLAGPQRTSPHGLAVHHVHEFGRVDDGQPPD